MTVEFDYYIYSTNYPETFEVGYSTTNNEVTSFTWGASVTAENTSALKYSANLPVGVKYIAIKHTSDDQYYLYIDNFSVAEYVAPACPAVSAATLQESAVTAHTATVSWTAGGEETAWNLQYKAAGGEWSSVIPVATTPSYNFEGLAENTLYFVRVQANCGEDLSEWTGDEAFSFPTDCEPKTVTKAQPWSYDFEDTNDGFMPACWERTEPYANYGYPVVAEYSYYAQSGDKYLYLRTPGRSGSSYTEDAILPVFNTEIKNLKVSFSYFNGAATSNYGQLAIGYVVGDAFTQVGELLAQVEDYTLVEREMPNDAPDGARIAIRCIGSTKGSSYTTTVYLDDIQVSLKPTCYTPTALAAQETSDGAVLTWTAGKDESEWSVRYSVKDADEWTTINEIATNGYTLTGLSQNVTYEVQVKAVCGVGDESEWSASVEFTPACNAPSALAVTARTANSATFSWTSSESAFVLQYSADGVNWESANVAAFENVATNALPACWEKISDGDYPSVVQGSASYEGENGKCLCFYGEGTQILVLPAYDVELAEYTLSFFYKNANATLELGYINNAGEFVLLQALDARSAYGDDAYQSALSNELRNKNLAIRYVGTNSMSSKAYLDVVRISKSLVLADNVNNSALLAANEGQTLDVQIGRTIVCADYYNTICLPFDLATLDGTPLEGGDLWAFKYAKVENNELLFRIIESDHIEAGVPYFISFPAGDNIVSPLFKNVTISAAAGQEVGDDVAKLCGIIDQPVVFNAGDQTKLFLAANNTLYWWNGSANSQLNSFRAYFKVGTGAGAPARHGMPARIIKQEESATGFENVQSDAQTLKLIENGNVVIIRNGVKYNIQGQVISK